MATAPTISVPYRSTRSLLRVLSRSTVTLVAYVANTSNNFMGLLQLGCAFGNAPLFATFALGMFWKRTTGHAAFVGLLAGR